MTTDIRLPQSCSCILTQWCWLLPASLCHFLDFPRSYCPFGVKWLHVMRPETQLNTPNYSHWVNKSSSMIFFIGGLAVISQLHNKTEQNQLTLIPWFTGPRLRPAGKRLTVHIASHLSSALGSRPCYFVLTTREWKGKVEKRKADIWRLEKVVAALSSLDLLLPLQRRLYERNMAVCEQARLCV